MSPGATGLHIDGQNAFHIDRGGRVVQIRQSTRADGSLALSDPDTPRHRRALADLPWTTLQQVHGAEVIAVDAPGARCGEAGDALITCEVDAVVAVQTADCVPIALIATDADGVPVGVGVVHAGWRGLLSGVVEASTAKLRARARAAALTAVIGAHIHACCYRFEVDDAAPLVGRYGVGLRATTSSGEPALDMTAGVRAALADAQVTVAHVHESCTGCEDEFFSHRVRRDVGRQALAVWMAS